MLLAHRGVQRLPVLPRNRPLSGAVKLCDRANQVAHEGISAAFHQKWRESFPRRRSGRHEHGITVASFRWERIRSRLGPTGVALLEQLQQIDIAIEQDLRHVMLVDIHDARVGDEISDGLRHSLQGAAEDYQRAESRAIAKKT